MSEYFLRNADPEQRLSAVVCQTPSRQTRELSCRPTTPTERLELSSPRVLFLLLMGFALRHPQVFCAVESDAFCESLVRSSELFEFDIRHEDMSVPGVQACKDRLLLL